MRLSTYERRQLAAEYLAARVPVTISEIYPDMVIAYQMTPEQRQRRKKLAAGVGIDRKCCNFAPK